MKRYFGVLVTLISILMLGTAAAEPPDTEQKFPDVVAVKVEASGIYRFDFDVTIASPYDSPQRYADAFRILSLAGHSFGERKVLHDHANEQPFTRDLYGVSIPLGVRMVVVQARDQKYGYGGKVQQVLLPGRN